MLALFLIVGIHVPLAIGYAIERRLGDIEVPALDNGGHVAEKERQQQRADVLTVNIGIGHANDTVIAELALVQLVANAGTEGGNQGADFGAGEHPIQPRLFHVENLAPQRQDGLELPVSSLFGGTTGGVPLDDEQLTAAGIALDAVGQLARERHPLESALADHQVTGFPGRFPRARRGERLFDDALGLVRMLMQPVA